MSTIANESEEKEHPEARSAPNEGGVYSAIFTEGAESIERPSSALFWSALSAGLSMGFSMVAQALIKSSLPEVEWRPLFVKLGYSVGFLIVVLGRQQLFTENTLMPVLPWLQHKTGNHFVNLLRVWAVVLMGNILGSFLFAIACYFSPVFESNVQKEFVSLGVMAVEHPFGTTFGRAIFGGWLIALMGWLMPFSGSARVFVIIIITYIVGIGHFSHIIAGSSEAFVAALNGAVSWSDVVTRFFIPTLFGNTLGGVFLVAGLNHAQVKSGKWKSDRN